MGVDGTRLQARAKCKHLQLRSVIIQDTHDNVDLQIGLR